MNKLKNEFPFFKNNKNTVFLDNAASTQKPFQVVNKIQNFYEKDYANIHRGIYKKSELATVLYEETRKTIASFLKCNQKNIILTNGTTFRINQIVYSLEKILNKNSLVVLTEAEHHANIIPWLHLQKKIKFKIEYLKIDKKGNIEINDIEKYKNAKILSAASVSNVIGVKNNILEVIKKLKNSNNELITIIDGAQGVPHNIKEIENIDYLLFSGHKIYSPSGTGVLYTSEKGLNFLEPLIFGGDMIENVSFKNYSLNDAPSRYEAGTPNIEGIIGMSEGIKFFMNNFSEIEMNTLTKYMYENFKNNIDFLEPIIEYSPKNIGIISLYSKKINLLDLAYYLSLKNIAFRIGHHCAMPLHKEKYNIESSLRFSLGIYNDKNDIDILISELIKAKKILEF